MNLVVIANDEGKHKTIAAQLKADDINLIAISALSELPQLLKEIPVSGILLDLVTSTRSSSNDKEATNELIQLYPHAKVKIINDEVLVLGSGVSLEQFAEDCKKFKPRTIRKSERKIRHIAFLLSADSSFENYEKVVTLNISDGGCFVYSVSEWQEGDRVWLRFIDNDSVMTGVVRWWQPWGNNKKMPGIGIKFDEKK